MGLFAKRFRNLHPHAPHTLLGVLGWKLGLVRQPEPSLIDDRYSTPEPAHDRSDDRPDAATSLAAPAKEKIRLTWIGHSTFLLEHQGRNILTDPIFGNCQPLPLGGLRRLGPPGLRLDSLPPIHDVLISHSHYDHLDAPTLRSLGDGPRYWVPSGLSGWFRKQGIHSCQELEWWESAWLSNEIAIHCVPAQHGSGRKAWDRNRTHWCGWVLRSSTRSAYFAGDTGYSPLFHEIGSRFGGFDLSMIPIGAYKPRWLMQAVHLNPYDAVKAHIDLASRFSVGCHWGTFALADEPIDEPPRALAHALRLQAIDPRSFRTLRAGEAIEI